MSSNIRNTPAKISIPTQAALIERIFPETQVTTWHGQRLAWTHTICPSPLGGEYRIRLEYDIADKPNIYVIEPKPLALAKGKTKLEHCYDHQTQCLCLYYPDGKEWNKGMILAKTIIPWTYEWLYHYEIWLGTGVWTGGGVHPSNNKKKHE